MEDADYSEKLSFATKRDVDFYAVLNIPRDATNEQIRASYKQLCRTYHPNMQAHNRTENGETSAAEATEKFHLVQEAYQTLTDENKRHIYDIYGIEGLNVNWEITADMSKEEVKDKLKKMMGTDPHAHISRESGLVLKLNAVDTETGGVKLPELTDLRVSHFARAAVDPSNTLLIYGQADTSGSGLWGTGWHHQLNPKDSLEVYLRGNSQVTGTTIALKHLLSPASEVELEGSADTSGRSRVHLSFGQKLPKGLTGKVSVAAGAGTNCAVSLSRQGENFKADVALETEMGEHRISAGGDYKLTKKTTLESKVVAPLGGDIHLRLGMRRFIAKFTQIGTFVKLTPEEVTVGFSVHREGHNVSLPIVVSENLSVTVAAWAVGVPVALWTFVRWVIWEPRRREIAKRKVERRRAQNAAAVARNRDEAQRAIALMQSTVKRKREAEEAITGLIIVSAWYGNLDYTPVDGTMLDESENPYSTDVTTPLQVLVDNSKLVLQRTTKAGLLGFHDPCPGEDKQLRVQYLFKDALHEVTVNDDEELSIPRRAHLLV